MARILPPFDLEVALRDFASYHRTRGNRVCHYFGLAFIAAAVLGALSRVPLGVAPLDLGAVLLLFTLLFDLLWSWRIAVGVLALGSALYALARGLPTEVLVALLAIGWSFQLVGHRVFEKNAPAFVDNARHLLVGPRWMVNRMVRAFDEGDDSLRS